MTSRALEGACRCQRLLARPTVLHDPEEVSRRTVAHRDVKLPHRPLQHFGGWRSLLFHSQQLRDRRSLQLLRSLPAGGGERSGEHGAASPPLDLLLLRAILRRHEHAAENAAALRASRSPLALESSS